MPRWSPGEFTRARLRLTGWYAGLLIVVLATVGVAAYVLMTASLDDQVDSALADEVLAIAPRLGQLVDSGATIPLPVVESGTTTTEEPTEDSGDDGAEEESAEEVLHELAERGQVPTHQLLLDLDGEVLESTLTVSTTPLRAPLAVARGQRADVRTISVDPERVRVRTQQVSLDGEPIGFVQAFRSLEDRDETATDLIQIFLIAGAVAGGVALIAGYVLSGRAIAPIRRNLEAQERFVADASHELRTPIAVVQSSADVLLRHPDHRVADEREVVEGIAEEAARMGTLVRDLLDLGTVHQAPLDRTTVDLRELAEAAMRGLASIADGRGVTLQVEPGAAAEAIGDPTAIGQILRILLDNAITHTASGTGVIVAVRETPDFAEIRVSDDGPGIPLEEQARVFERFARVDKTRARAQGNSGLGLSIAQALVRRHGGSIDLDSNPGAGATFTVQLPHRR